MEQLYMKNHTKKLEIGPIEYIQQKFPFEIKVHVDHQFPIRSYAGCNRLYNTRKFTYYYLFNLNTWTIHTNNRLLFTYANNYKINSTSRQPNEKYIITKMLTRMLHIQGKLPSRIRRKYFYRIRNLIYNQLLAIKSRDKKHNDQHDNRRTKTFIRFSYKKIAMYFGIYRPCHCKLPACFVMSKGRFRCPHHVQEILQTQQLRQNQIDKSTHNPLIFKDHIKENTSNRLGIKYYRDFSWVFDFRMVKRQYLTEQFSKSSRSKKQEKRFERHKKSILKKGVPSPAFFCKNIDVKIRAERNKNGKVYSTKELAAMRKHYRQVWHKNKMNKGQFSKNWNIQSRPAEIKELKEKKKKKMVEEKTVAKRIFSDERKRFELIYHKKKGYYHWEATKEVREEYRKNLSPRVLESKKRVLKALFDRQMVSVDDKNIDLEKVQTVKDVTFKFSPREKECTDDYSRLTEMCRHENHSLAEIYEALSTRLRNDDEEKIFSELRGYLVFLPKLD